MKLKVDGELCVGCGLCEQAFEKNFKVLDDTYISVFRGDISSDNGQQIIADCPVSAITKDETLIPPQPNKEVLREIVKRIPRDNYSYDEAVIAEIMYWHTRQCEEMRKEIVELKQSNRGYKKMIKTCPQAQVCPYVKVATFDEQRDRIMADKTKLLEEHRQQYANKYLEVIALTAELATAKKDLERVRSITAEDIAQIVFSDIYPDNNFYGSRPEGSSERCMELAQAIHALINQKGE